MANREAFKEYGRLIEREAEGERARQQRPQAKVGKSLGKELRIVLSPRRTTR